MLENYDYRAEIIAAAIRNSRQITDAALAGYVQAMEDDERLSIAEPNPPRRVLVDYGGPNMSKSMHVGHLRASIIGESLKRLFRVAGHDVSGDIHMGDWGMPIGQLIIELERRHLRANLATAGDTRPYIAVVLERA